MNVTEDFYLGYTHAAKRLDHFAEVALDGRDQEIAKALAAVLRAFAPRPGSVFDAD